MNYFDWISCDFALPAKFMRVRWQYDDLTEDIGIWNHGHFMTYDPNKLLPIINWKPLEL